MKRCFACDFIRTQLRSLMIRCIFLKTSQTFGKSAHAGIERIPIGWRKRRGLRNIKRRKQRRSKVGSYLFKARQRASNVCFDNLIATNAKSDKSPAMKYVVLNDSTC